MGRKGATQGGRRVRVTQVVDHVDDLEGVALHRDLLLRRARATLVGDSDIAEDLVQDAFVELAEGTGVAAAQHRSLLHAALAVVRVRAYLRKRYPGRQFVSLHGLDADEHTSADPAQVVEDRLLLLSVCQGLTAWQRQLILERLL